MDEGFIFEKAPHSLEAEQSVIGALLIDAPKCAAQVISALKPDEFYTDMNRSIYEVICSMFSASKPIDAVTVLNEMRLQGVFNAQTSQSYLVELMSVTPTVANVMRYVDIVRDKAALRTVAEIAQDTTSKIRDGNEDAETVLQNAYQRMERLTKSFSAHDRELPMSCKFERIIGEYSSGKYEALPTGFPRLNDALGGGLRAGLYVLGAATGAGKSALAMQIAEDYAKMHKRPVLMLALELGEAELLARSLSRISWELSKNDGSIYPIMATNILDNCIGTYQDEIESFLKCREHYLQRIAEKEVIVESKELTPDEIRPIVQRVTNYFNGTAPLVILDYLQLLKPSDTRISEVERLRNAAMTLKQISREFNVPVIAISTLNRANKDRAADTSDFMGSSGIEASADIAFVLQPTAIITDKNNYDEVNERTKSERDMTLNIVKGRAVKATRDLHFIFRGAYSHFEEA